MAFVEPHEAGKWPSAFWAAFWLVAFSLPLLISFADSGAPAPAPYTVVWIDSLPSAPAPKLERKPGKDLADIARRAEEKKDAARRAEEKRNAARRAEEKKERKRLAKAEKKAELLAEEKRKKIIEDREKREEENRLRREERDREKQEEEEEREERKRIERLAAEELRLREEEDRAKQLAAAEAAEAKATAAADAAAEAERNRLAELFGVYERRISRKIEIYLNQPVGLPSDADIEATILIRVDADGFLIDGSEPVVWKTSGYPEYDTAAIRAVIQAQPLPMPKDEPVLLEKFRELRLIVEPGDF